MVNSDPNGLGMRFKDTATNLMLADPLLQQARRSKTGESISFSLAGRGGTGVDLCWCPAKEFKELSLEQRDELMEGRNSNKGKAVIKAGRVKAKAKRADDAEKGKGGKRGSSGDENKPDPKRQKKYQESVAKTTNKLLPSSLEAEKSEAETMNAQLAAAIQRR